MQATQSHPAHTAATSAAAAPGFGLLVRLKLRLLRNRLRQLVDERPLQLLLIFLFVGTIWGGLYLIFDRVLILIRQHEEQAVIALPYIFHLFFAAMTMLLAFSTAVLVYGSLYARDEPAFLLSAPNAPRHIVAIVYVESLFYSSWSLVLLGLPLMLAIGHVQGLPWHFYPVFILAFLGFVPIPGAMGLLAAMAVALYLPRIAKRTVLYTAGVSVILAMVWWGRLWTVSASHAAPEWIEKFLGELSYLKAALLPSTWPSKAIQFSIQDEPVQAAFYLAVTISTGLFVSYWASLAVSRRLLTAFGRAQASPTRSRAYSGWMSRWLTRAAFFYLPEQMRAMILKDVRSFLRDPIQWSQLAILFGLLGLYLAYLPRSAPPDGFNVGWKALICFLNFGAITLILSTFTSRFVFPLISIEGKQMWLVGLLPMSRGKILWAKGAYAVTLTGFAAMIITWLAVRAIDLPPMLAMMQAAATLTTCIGLCGLAIGLGARMPSFDETNTSRISSGLGGTVNLIASVGLVAISVGLFGAGCWKLAEAGRLDAITMRAATAFAAVIVLGLGTAVLSMSLGLRSFRTQEF